MAQRSADLGLIAQLIGAVDRGAGLSVHLRRSERGPRSLGAEALMAAAEANVSVLEPMVL